jgi:hypothetical protein
MVCERFFKPAKRRALTSERASFQHEGIHQAMEVGLNINFITAAKENIFANTIISQSN